MSWILIFERNLGEWLVVVLSIGLYWLRKKQRASASLPQSADIPLPQSSTQVAVTADNGR